MNLEPDVYKVLFLVTGIVLLVVCVIFFSTMLYIDRVVRRERRELYSRLMSGTLRDYALHEKLLEPDRVENIEQAEQIYSPPIDTIEEHFAPHNDVSDAELGYGKSEYRRLME